MLLSKTRRDILSVWMNPKCSVPRWYEDHAKQSSQGEAADCPSPFG